MTKKQSQKVAFFLRDSVKLVSQTVICITNEFIYFKYFAVS